MQHFCFVNPILCFVSFPVKVVSDHGIQANLGSAGRFDWTTTAWINEQISFSWNVIIKFTTMSSNSYFGHVA